MIFWDSHDSNVRMFFGYSRAQWRLQAFFSWLLSLILVIWRICLKFFHKTWSPYSKHFLKINLTFSSFLLLKFPRLLVAQPTLSTAHHLFEFIKLRDRFHQLWYIKLVPTPFLYFKLRTQEICERSFRQWNIVEYLWVPPCRGKVLYGTKAEMNGDKKNSWSWQIHLHYLPFTE